LVTTTTTTTVVATAAPFSTARLGGEPSEPLAGSGGAAGSGCAPGSDELPDGAWFGWIDSVGEGSVAFDLACLWPGRLEPAVSNDRTLLRSVPIDAEAVVRARVSTTKTFAEWVEEGARRTLEAPGAPGMPASLPWWLFVNDGLITEMVEVAKAPMWRRVSDYPSWAYQVCCTNNATAPASPADPFPAGGLPADGAYAVVVERDTVNLGALRATISKWVPCSSGLEGCHDPQPGDVTTIAGTGIRRDIVLDDSVTVVIAEARDSTSGGIGSALVGSGVQFDLLLMDVDVSLWAAEDRLARGGTTYGELGAADPEFPFGILEAWQGRGPVAYRGPGGAMLLLVPSADSSGYAGIPGSTVLEIRDGQVVIYVDAATFVG
jgi:hypothetical protein